jgi:hypothetical protein
MVQLVVYVHFQSPADAVSSDINLYFQFDLARRMFSHSFTCKVRTQFPPNCPTPDGTLRTFVQVITPSAAMKYRQTDVSKQCKSFNTTTPF